ncbi:hypothetical protein CVT24_010132 [Panaeolus cyanescens]|uniref:DUF4939 domain-containing protein n=1 Tax=Panaeolus cyanescens TaxID=181874 RepID=A0A409YVX7_9AGAR|nr:hypothetical protein CVT24_010132 [Panaeolus cyanescens]
MDTDNPQPTSPVESHSNTSEKELRIGLPTPFSGDRSKLASFIQDCKLYLTINEGLYHNDERKIAFVLSFMTGGMQLYGSSNLSNPGPMFKKISTWELETNSGGISENHSKKKKWSTMLSRNSQISNKAANRQNNTISISD